MLITRSVVNHVALEGYIAWQNLVMVQGKYKSSIELDGMKKRNNCTMNQFTKICEIITVAFRILKNKTACSPVHFKT